MRYFSFGLGHPHVSGVLRLARRPLAPHHHADADVREQQNGKRYAVLEHQQRHVVEMPDVLARPRFDANVMAALLTRAHKRDDKISGPPRHPIWT